MLKTTQCCSDLNPPRPDRASVGQGRGAANPDLGLRSIFRAASSKAGAASWVRLVPFAQPQAVGAAHALPDPKLCEQRDGQRSVICRQIRRRRLVRNVPSEIDLCLNRLAIAHLQYFRVAKPFACRCRALAGHHHSIAFGDERIHEGKAHRVLAVRSASSEVRGTVDPIVERAREMKIASNQSFRRCAVVRYIGLVDSSCDIGGFGHEGRPACARTTRFRSGSRRRNKLTLSPGSSLPGSSPAPASRACSSGSPVTIVRPVAKVLVHRCASA